MVSSYDLQTCFSPYNLQLQFSNQTVHQTKRVQDDFSSTIFRANTVKGYNSFSQWNTPRTVSLKVLCQTHTDTSTLPISVCLHQLSLKSKRIAADLSNRELSPKPFSVQPLDTIKQSCQDPQPLSSRTQQFVKENAFLLSLTHILRSSLVFVTSLKRKAFLLLPKTKVCACLHCVVLFQLYYFNLASVKRMQD